MVSIRLDLEKLTPLAAKDKMLIDVLLSRRSVRQYRDEAVSDDLLTTALKVAMSAPSAGNEQPCHFVVIRERAILQGIPEAHPQAYMVPQAALAVLVCGDLTLDLHRGYWVQDCSAATENLLLGVHAMGLGAVWVGVYPREDRVAFYRRLLNIPEHVVPFSLVPMGYPGEKLGPANRFDAAKVHHNCW